MSVATEIDLSRMDLVNPDSYVERVPFEWFDELRQEAPVIWHPEAAPNHGFWAVTRYDDLVTVHMDWQTYSSEKGAVSLEELDDDQLKIRKSMLETDPPRHRELRNICNKRFSARGVGAYEDFIRDVARTVLDRALEKEEFDFTLEVAKELPIRFLCAIFTVPQDDAPMLIRWGDAMIGNQDPEFTDAVVDKVDTEEFRNLPFRSPIALEMFEYAHRQRDERLDEPQDDVINALSVAQREGTLTEREFDNYFGLLMIAGNETTRHTISHGMLALMEHPDQMRMLQDDPGLIPHAVEEILRWASPVMHFRRTAARDVELRGQADPRGRQGRHLVHQRQPRRAAVRGPLPVRRLTPRGGRARDVRAGRSALLPRRAPRQARDQGPVPGAAPAPPVDRAHGAGRADALELRERHQAHAGPRDPRVTGAPRTR